MKTTYSIIIIIIHSIYIAPFTNPRTIIISSVIVVQVLPRTVQNVEVLVHYLHYFILLLHCNIELFTPLHLSVRFSYFPETGYEYKIVKK